MKILDRIFSVRRMQLDFPCWKISNYFFLLISSAILEVLILTGIFPVFLILIGEPIVLNKGPLSLIFELATKISRVNLLVLSIFFIFILGLVRAQLVKVGTVISFNLSCNMVESLMRSIIYTPYSVLQKKNSAHLIDLLTSKANIVVYGVFFSAITLMGTIFITFSVLCAALYLYPYLSTVTFLCLGIMYFIVVLQTKNKLKNFSSVISTSSAHFYKSATEAIKSIRDIKLDSAEEITIQNLMCIDRNQRNAQAYVAIYTQIPRYIVESFALILIFTVAFFYANYNLGNGYDYLIVLIFAQRLLPLIQQVYASFANVTASLDSLDDVLHALNEEQDQKITSNNNYEFKKTILLNNICFQHDKNSIGLNNLTFKIDRNDRILILGESGSGKSTLLDLLLGLLPPDSGEILIDDTRINKNDLRFIQGNFSHVPQNVYLVDDSIKANILFNDLEPFDASRLNMALEISSLLDFVNSLPHGVDTRISENGALLSGGQRQRLGLARALYKQSKILVLDEATSALDANNENQVMARLDSLKDLTIIVVSHRILNYKMYNKIYELRGGVLMDVRNEYI